MILAVDSPDTDYVSMAQQLSRSLKAWHPDAKTCLLTNHMVQAQEFDYVTLLPHGDLGGYRNDWQCWYSTPFRETIKLEADMLVVSEIDHWWPMLRHRDVVVSTGARDFYDNPAVSRHYRRTFDENNLPDVYNAITYWRLSATAQRFWQTVKDIFENWSQFRELIKFAPEQPDTDLVYAMTAEILGRDQVTLPIASYPRIVHMKQHIISGRSKTWTDDLTWELVDHELRVNTIQQWGCFHYHVKDWKPNA